MKRWGPWFLLVVALCGLVFASRSESPALLEDTDTVALLNRLKEVRDPTAWFKGDWPLQNHFYRPVSTLTFELDTMMAGGYSGDGATGPEAAASFGVSNAVYAIACIMLLFWLLRELTDVPWLSGVATGLFALWHLGDQYVGWIEVAVAWLAPLCLLGLLRGGLAKLVPCVFAALACLFLTSQMLPVEEFSSRIVQWLPGRTASVMTVFALLSLATYARYVRTTGTALPRDATSEDLPATKSTSVLRNARLPGVLVVVSCICLLLSLGSYEQAVMVPALLFGVWLLFRMRGHCSAWWPHVAFWLLLLGYLVLRARLVPSDVSGYQEQQFRSGPGVWVALGDYLLPSAYSLYFNLSSLSVGWLLVMTGNFWAPVLTAVANWTTYWKAWCDSQWRWPIVGFLLMSFVAYLPMAWLKPFGHYHYLPSAFRAAYVVVLAAVVWKLVITAASLPELRAPARRGPAPGSLPRP